MSDLTQLSLLKFDSSKMPTLADVATITANILHDAGIFEFATEARMLVCHGLDISAIELITHAMCQIDKQSLWALEGLIKRRIGGEPVGRIIGVKEFYGFKFHLSADTLEPRSDTETLVDSVLEDFDGRQNLPLKLLDIGTGTGAIIVSLLKNLPFATAFASDINENALLTARKNAAEAGILDRVLFINTNWCAGIGQKFDVIVSNPPYIRPDIIATLASEVKDYDPIIALDGGEDGLDAYRDIFTQCSSKIDNMGKLYLEIGFDQRESVCILAAATGWKFVRYVKDLGANDRVLIFARQSIEKMSNL